MSAAQTMYDLYLAAEVAVLEGKSVTLRGEQMTMEDLDAIRAGRMEWERKINSAKAGGNGYSLASWC